MVHAKPRRREETLSRHRLIPETYSLKRNHDGRVASPLVQTSSRLRVKFLSKEKRDPYSPLGVTPLHNRLRWRSPSLGGRIFGGLSIANLAGGVAGKLSGCVRQAFHARRLDGQLAQQLARCFIQALEQAAQVDLVIGAVDEADGERMLFRLAWQKHR